MTCPKHVWWTGNPDDCPGCGVEAYNIALDQDGKPLPSYSPDDVETMSDVIMRKGKLLLSVWLMPDNDIAVRVEGPPNPRLYEVLKRAVEGYGRSMKGH